MPEDSLSVLVLPFQKIDGRILLDRTEKIIGDSFAYSRVVGRFNRNRQHFRCKSRADALSYLIASYALFKCSDAAVRKGNVNHK